MFVARPRRRSLAALVLLLFSLGCVSVPLGSFTIMAPPGHDQAAHVLQKNVVGTHCIYDHILVPFWRRGPTLPSYQIAVERAIASVPGADVMLDARIAYEQLLLLLWSRQCARVAGNAGAFE